MTREVARAIEIGTKRKNAPKMTLTEQVEYLTTRLAAREEYIKELESRLDIIVAVNHTEKHTPAKVYKKCH